MARAKGKSVALNRFPWGYRVTMQHPEGRGFYRETPGEPNGVGSPVERDAATLFQDRREAHAVALRLTRHGIPCAVWFDPGGSGGRLTPDRMRPKA